MSDHYWYLWCVRKRVWMEKRRKKVLYLTITLQQVYQLPSSKVPLYVELLAGTTLFRAPIAEDLQHSPEHILMLCPGTQSAACYKKQWQKPSPPSLMLILYLHSHFSYIWAKAREHPCHNSIRSSLYLVHLHTVTNPFTIPTELGTSTRKHGKKWTYIYGRRFKICAHS